MKALVLSGGGSRGAYQAGCWQAIHDTGWRPDLVVGTSVGALNGALIAAHTPVDEILRWWHGLRQGDVLRSKRNLLGARRWRSFYDATPLRKLIEANLDLDLLRKGTPLRVHAVCLETGQEVLWATPELTIDHFMATTALMPGLPPVQIGEHHYADGGHWGALPLRHALEAGATEVHVLLHDPLEPHPEPVPRTIRQIVRRQSDIVWHGRQHAEWDALQLRMQLPKKHPRHLHRASIAFHAPEPALENEILRFNPRLAAKHIHRGLKETRGRLAATA